MGEEMRLRECWLVVLQECGDENGLTSRVAPYVPMCLSIVVVGNGCVGVGQGGILMEMSHLGCVSGKGG